MAHYYFENTPHGLRRDGSKLDTKIHAAYITRSGKYAHIRNREEDLVCTKSGNMPDWADNPLAFWEQAELHRRKNGRAYREFRIGLQEEFTLEENIALVERFLEESGVKQQHAYTYAIHDKNATFDKSHRNIHCHIMINEKIIEPDRPLAPDKYFKNYSENQQGKPSSGYRTNAYFADRNTTIALRKKWAEIVNEQFKEKGMSERISEKSNLDRMQELKEAGKMDEADLFDRVPSPHLGSSYRNPKIMERIEERIRKVDIKNDEADDSDIASVGNMSEQEKTIAYFANDFVMRKIARIIQNERLLMQKEIEEKRLQEDAAEIISEPYIITLGDIYDAVAEKAEAAATTTEEKLSIYRAQKKALRDKTSLLRAAERAVLGNRLSELKKAYAENAKALEKARKERNMLIGVPGKIHELASYGHRIEVLTQKQKKIGYALRIEKEAAENRKDEIDKVLQEMQIENQSKEQTAKKSYKEYLVAKNAEKDLSELMQRLKDEQRNTVIFSERLPKALTRRMKLYGKERIGNLKFRVLQGQSFAILPNKQGQSFAILPNKKDAQTNIIFAVRLGDDIKDGCVPLYELRETSSERTGKPRLTAYRTDKKMPLYDANKSKKDKETTPSSSSTLEAAKRQRYAEIQDKVSSIVNYLTKTQEPVGKLRAHWEEEQLHDKAVQQEEKMYRGWSM